MCAHIHVDADVCELRVYFFCREKSQIPRSCRKDGVDILFLTKSEEISQEMGPDYLAQKGPTP